MRLLILILLFPFISEAQIIRANPFYKTGTTTVYDTLILDQYPSAAIGYSFRKLRNAYSGSAIRVRESGGNTESDIGFVNNYLDTATLKTFCGANSGYLVKWYDQSGNGIDASQSTSGKQPRIVNAGAIEYQGLWPSLLLDGSDDYLVTASATLNAYQGLFMVTKCTLGNPFFIEQTTNAVSNPGFTFYGSNNAPWLWNRGGSLNYGSGVSGWAGTNLILATEIYNGSGGAYYKNGSVQSNGSVTGSPVSNTTASGAIYIYSRAGSSLFGNGNLTEFVLWSSDKSSDRTSIETNIKNFYSLY